MRAAVMTRALDGAPVIGEACTTAGTKEFGMGSLVAVLRFAP